MSTIESVIPPRPIEIRPTPQRIALCMIVRDAKETIDALLESVLGREAGPARFSEYVFVDTGSTDDTRERIVEAFNARCVGFGEEPGTPSVGEFPMHFPTESGKAHAYKVALTPIGSGNAVRVVLAKFDWISDFAAARNFSFDLAVADWRMYLDADDVLPTAPFFLKTLAATVARNKDVNCVVMPYDYAADTQQMVRRLVRWADGWKWFGRVHERMERVAKGACVIDRWHPAIVQHRPAPGHFEPQGSLERNRRIAEISYGETTDRKQRGLDAYTLGLYWATKVGEMQLAKAFLYEASDLLAFTNIGCLALVHLAQAQANTGELDQAIENAGRAIAHAPELPDGYAALAIHLKAKGDYARAIEMFNIALARPKPALHTAYDPIVLDGLLPVHAAEMFLAIGNLDRAGEVFNSIPEAVREDPAVRAIARHVSRKINRITLQRHGLDLLQQMHDFWNWSCEPIKFRKILRELLPESIAELPEIRAIWKRVDEKLPHLENWEAYQKAYRDIPNDTFHTADALRDHVRNNLGRTKQVVAWAKGLPQEGPPVYVCAIGAQDCIIEEAVMDANPRVHMTAVDVSPTAAKGILELAEKFPGRVTTHQIQRNHYDWPYFVPGTVTSFDAVILFEVIEHVPDDLTAFKTIHAMLKSTGHFFMSTPIASEWIEPYLTGPMPPWHFHGHVRGFSPSLLWKLAKAAGFTGSLRSTDGGTLFFGDFTPFDWPSTRATATRRGPVKLVNERLSIPTLWAPLPFDPQSLHEGHVGGSEEAVIRLAPALAARGIDVTVFTSLPERDERFFVVDGVQWRPIDQFDPSGDHGTVLFWRAPQTLLEPEIKAATYRKFLWLHDLNHGAPPAAYDEPIKSIVLSQTAVDELVKLDGARADQLVIAQNGVDEQAFPRLDLERDILERDPHRCIYAQSPNRGLQHLLAIWPVVRAAVPDAKLDIFYDWGMFRTSYPKWAADLDTMIALLANQGVTYHGGVSHDVLFNAYRRAGVWAYPSIYKETFCTSAVIAQAAGAWPVTTNLGALVETVLTGDIVQPTLWPEGTPFEVTATEFYAHYPDPAGHEELLAERRAEFRERYTAALIARLLNPPGFEERVSMRRRALETFAWSKTAAIFDGIMFPERRDRVGGFPPGW